MKKKTILSILDAVIAKFFIIVDSLCIEIQSFPVLYSCGGLGEEGGVNFLS